MLSNCGLEKNLESPLDSKIKSINPEYSLEELMLKLKLQYFSHMMWRADSLEKTLMLGKIEGNRKRGWWESGWDHQLNGHEFEQIQGDSGGQVSLACYSPWDRKEWDMTEQLNWNELKQFYFWANFVYHLVVNGSTALGPLSPVNHYSEVCLWLWIALCSHCSSETSRFGFKPSKKGRK